MFASDESMLFLCVFWHLLLGLLQFQNVKFFPSELKLTTQKLTWAEFNDPLINDVG